MAFLKDRLSGEGDVMRHLASKGYRLGYEQDPRAEFVFGVSNLAVDLRNGMRICKLVELLSGECCAAPGHTFHAEHRSAFDRRIGPHWLSYELSSVRWSYRWCNSK